MPLSYGRAPVRRNSISRATGACRAAFAHRRVPGVARRRPRLVRSPRPRPGLPRDHGSLRDPGFRDDGAANPGCPCGRLLDTFHGGVSDRPDARRGDAGRRSPRVARPRVQPPGPRAAQGRDRDRGRPPVGTFPTTSRHSGGFPASGRTRHARLPPWHSGGLSARSMSTSDGCSRGRSAVPSAHLGQRSCRGSPTPACRRMRRVPGHTP